MVVFIYVLSTVLLFYSIFSLKSHFHLYFILWPIIDHLDIWMLEDGVVSRGCFHWFSSQCSLDRLMDGWTGTSPPLTGSYHEALIETWANLDSKWNITSPKTTIMHIFLYKFSFHYKISQSVNIQSRKI